MTSDLTSATLITLVSMCILPPMASEDMTASEAVAASKRPRRSYDLRIDIINLNYPGIHVLIASNGLRGHGGHQTTLEVTSDLKIQLSDLGYLCSHGSLASKGLHEINDTQAEEVYLPLTCVASPQVKTSRMHSPQISKVISKPVGFSDIDGIYNNFTLLVSHFQASI